MSWRHWFRMSSARRERADQVESTDRQASRRPLFGELPARYWSVLRESWRLRHELAGPARLADEAAFLPAALSLEDTPVHPAPRRFAWAIMALFGLALLWACLGHVDVMAIAPGRIVVSDRTKVVQSLEPGIVRRLLVKDGDHVTAGQVLMELDPTTADADSASVGEQLEFMQSESQRSAALLKRLAAGRTLPIEGITDANVRVQLEAEWEEISARVSRLDAEFRRREAEVATALEVIAKLQETLPILQAREKDFLNLVSQGFVSSHSVQDKARERIEMERDLATQKSKLVEARLAVEETQRTKGSYLAETRRSLQTRVAESQSRFRQLAQEQSKASQKRLLSRLVAPVSGTVQQLAVHTEGGVVTQAQVLMVIVPADVGVTAEVTLENKDVGFVEVGQEVTIKLETFPFTRYGTVPATVKWVTPDAVPDEKLGAIFPALIVLRDQQMVIDGRRVNLTPGMNLSAEIRTGDRRVIDFLLSPLQRATGESLRER